MKVHDVVNVYLANISSRIHSGTLSEQCAENYRRDLACFLEQFGQRPIENLRQHDLADFLEAHPTWTAVNTKRSRIASVLACFRWARDEEIIAVCPYASPRSLRGLIAETRRPATLEEFDALMAVGSPALCRALSFLFLTGCRTCEMRLLTWDNVRLDDPGHAPHLVLFKHKTVRKTGRPRIVGLDPQAVHLLQSIRSTQSGDFVFTNCDGLPWTKNAFCHNVRRAAKRAGLDDGAEDRVSAYCLRHTYACDGIEAGFTADQVAHQLGNSPEIVTRVYSKKLGQRVDFVSSIAVAVGERRRVSE